ncbi:PilZ domain-containing protein [Desulfohalovibrio reitneri]|uniref:PilZ domain-containing protein n=1 Tax=Desulfohalovibrio reitneri TaxID=1307759 RepID=UPI0004A71394|nr:PilZ domain-containing protein [Desulfohalovibrio reitneri]
MKKETPRIVYVQPEIYEALKTISSSVGLSPEHLAEGILSRYVHRAQATMLASNEKRKFHREKMGIPAIISLPGEEKNVYKYKYAQIQDISLGGVCLSLEAPHQVPEKPQEVKEGTKFDLLFSLASKDEQLAFRCQSARCELSEHRIYIGAQFMQAFNESHLVMQRYLM